jgi:hypothetical protein
MKLESARLREVTHSERSEVQGHRRLGTVFNPSPGIQPPRRTLSHAYLYVPPQVQSVAVTRITFSLMPYRPHDKPTVARPFSHEETNRRLRHPHFVR